MPKSPKERYGFMPVAMLLVTLIPALFCTAVLSAPSAAPAKAEAPAAAPATAPQPAAPAGPAQPSSSAVNPVTEVAVQSGVLACVSRINQVVSYLTASSKSHAYLFLPQKQPDQSIFSVSLATEGLDGSKKYCSASFAPTTNGQAAAVYDTVEYLDQPPDAVEKSVFKNLKRKGTLGKDTIVMDGGVVSIFLMPAGSGCIVIKKEVVQ